MAACVNGPSHCGALGVSGAGGYFKRDGPNKWERERGVRVEVGGGSNGHVLLLKPR